LPENNREDVIALKEKLEKEVNIFKIAFGFSKIDH